MFRTKNKRAPITPKRRTRRQKQTNNALNNNTRTTNTDRPNNQSDDPVDTNIGSLNNTPLSASIQMARPQTIFTPVRADNNDTHLNSEKTVGFGHSLQLLGGHFDGEPDNCRFFFQQLDEVALISGWSNTQKLAVLKSRLKGNALSFFLSDNDLNSCRDYELVKQKLTDYFSSDLGLAEAQIAFNSIRQWTNEPVKAFAHRLLLASNNFLGSPQITTPEIKNMMDKVRLSKFVSSVLPQLQSDVLKLNPQSFEEAVKIASNSQRAHDMLEKFQINNIKGLTMGGAENNEILTQQMSQLAVEPCIAKNLGQEKNIQCVFCGKRDHLAINCEVYQHLRQNRPRETLNTECQRGNTFRGRIHRGRYQAHNRFQNNFYQHNNGFQNGRQNNGNYYNRQSRGNFNGNTQQNTQYEHQDDPRDGGNRQNEPQTTAEPQPIAQDHFLAIAGPSQTQ